MYFYDHTKKEGFLLLWGFFKIGYYAIGLLIWATEHLFGLCVVPKLIRL